MTQQPQGSARNVRVSWSRLTGWIERFSARHPGTTWRVTSTDVSALAPDGARARFDVPFAPLQSAALGDLEPHLARPWHVGYLLVRRGGFAVARSVGEEVAAVKLGRRHVQARTKAGGWSQQRFARRRDNQAQVAYDAAAEHAVQLLVPFAADLQLLATGGDRRAVTAIIEDPSLSALQQAPSHFLAAYGEPGRDMLNRAVQEVRSVAIEVYDPLQSR